MTGSAPKSERSSLATLRASADWRYLLPGIALILGMIVLIGMTARSQWRDVEHEVEITSLTLAEVLAANADRLLETADLVRLQVAELVGDGDTLLADESRHEQLARLARVTPSLASIWVGDAKGTAVLTSRTYPTPALSAADRAYFTTVRDDADHLYIGTLTDNRYKDEILISTSRRLPAEDGAFRGFVQVSLNPTHLRRTFANVRLPYQTSLKLLAADGTPLMREPLVPADQLEHLTFPGFNPHATEPTQVLHGLSTADGKERSWFVARSPVYGLFVLVGVEQSELAAMERAKVMPTLALGSLLVVALAAILVFVHWQQQVGRRYAALLEQEVATRTADLRRVNEERELVIEELRHRVGNVFSVILALSRQSIAAAKSLESLKRDLPSRLASLAASQALLLRSDDRRSASLHDLVRAELAPYRPSDHPQITVDGPAVRLPEQKVTALGMVLHELVTNAVKHGALAVADGRLEITWRLEAEGRELVLDWVELDGPPVPLESDGGFGQELIERSAELLRGRAKLDLEPTGLRAQLTVPL